LLARLKDPVPAAVASRFGELLTRRMRREPVAYIRGRKEFMSLDFEVAPSVMIPRPDTESLVEYALDFLNGLDHDATVMDLCTGSGCIGISIAVWGRKCRVYASDILRGALDVAQRNAARHGVGDRMMFVEGDLYDAFDIDRMTGMFDLIISNPPYVSEAEWRDLQPEASEYEPRGALVAGEDRFAVVRDVIEGAPRLLRPGGMLLVEMTDEMAAEAQRHAQAMGLFGEMGAVHTLGGRVCGTWAWDRP